MLKYVVEQDAIKTLVIEGQKIRFHQVNRKPLQTTPLNRSRIYINADGTGATTHKITDPTANIKYSTLELSF
jgi:hypothetical protein